VKLDQPHHARTGSAAAFEISTNPGSIRAIKLLARLYSEGI
jgi:hypothetical protein